MTDCLISTCIVHAVQFFTDILHFGLTSVCVSGSIHQTRTVMQHQHVCEVVHLSLIESVSHHVTGEPVLHLSGNVHVLTLNILFYA